MANSEHIYIGCRYAKAALGDGGHSRRKAEAFAFAIYIKAKLGHSAAKKEQIERFYDELGIGRRRKQRLIPDIVKFNMGELKPNGTLAIKRIKEYKYDNIQIGRERITSCSCLSSLIYIIREIAFVYHIHRQCQVNYFKRNLQTPKTLDLYKESRRRLRESVEKDTIYDFWGFKSILRLLHSGKEKAYRLIGNLSNDGIIKIEKGLWTKVTDNIYDITHIGDDLKNIFFSELKKNDGKGLFVYGNTLYSIDSNKYYLNKDMNIYTIFHHRKKLSPFYCCK